MSGPKENVQEEVVKDEAEKESEESKDKPDAHTVSVPGLGVLMADGGSPLDEDEIDSELSFDDYCELKFPDIKLG